MTKKVKSEKKASIRARIQKEVLLITLIPLVILGLITSYLNYSSTNAMLKQTMKETVEIAAERVEWEITSYKNIAIDLGTLTRMSNTSLTEAEKQELIDQKVALYQLDRGKLIGTDGIAHIDGTDYNDREYFHASMRGEVYVTEPMISKATGGLSIMISAPVWKDGKENTEVVGVVFIVPDESFLNDIAESIQVSEGGSAYILDSTGTTIAHKDMELVKSFSNTIADYEKDKSLKGLANIESRMVAGEAGFGTYRYGGVNKFMAYAPIEGTNGWSIGINAPTRDFMMETIIGIFITVFIVAVSIVIAGYIARRLAAGIGNPIVQCAERLELLALGDLHSPVPEIHSEDETGILARTTAKIVSSLNEIIGDIKFILAAMASNDFAVSSDKKESYIGDYETILLSMREIKYSLSATIKNIKEASLQVSAGAGQLAEGAQALAEGATDQAGAVEELLATVTNAVSQMETSAESAVNTSKQAKEIGDEAKSSTEQVKRMTEAMERIKEASSEIANIIGSIEEIADQTNLLSLNASIEAARAGEAGRGFAVVANEISKLANQSAEAVDNTRGLIDTALEEVKNGNVIAEQTAGSLYEMIGGIENIVTSIEEVAVSANEQKESMLQINQGIEQISSVVEMNSSTAEESSAMSEELSAQAESLTSLISKFKIKSGS